MNTYLSDDSISTLHNMDIKLSSMERAKKWPGAEYIGDDILLVESPSQAPFPHNGRQMTFNLVALCTKGHASYTVDTVERHVSAGEVLIIGEGHYVDNFAPSADLDGLCMMVSEDFFSETISNVADFSSFLLFSLTNPVVPLSEHDQALFSNYFQLIRDKIGDTQSYYRRNVVSALILAMLYDMGNVIYQGIQADEKLKGRAYSIFTKFIQLVEQHHRKERRVSWYAGELNITPKYLSETIKGVSLITPNEWIDRYVILEMRLLLKRSDKTIKEIAKELDFPNQSFMGKFFKEHTGISPSAYRKM